MNTSRRALPVAIIAPLLLTLLGPVIAPGHAAWSAGADDSIEHRVIISGVEGHWLAYAQLYVEDPHFTHRLSEDPRVADSNDAKDWLENRQVTFSVEPLGGPDTEMAVLRVTVPDDEPEGSDLAEAAGDLLLAEITDQRRVQMLGWLEALDEQRLELEQTLDDAQTSIVHHARSAMSADIEGDSERAELAALIEQYLQVDRECRLAREELAAAERAVRQRQYNTAPGAQAAVADDDTVRAMKDALGALIAASVAADQDAERQRAQRGIDPLEEAIAERQADAAEEYARALVVTLTARVERFMTILQDMEMSIDLAEHDLREAGRVLIELRALQAAQDAPRDRMARLDERIEELQLELEDGPQVLTTLRD